MDMNKTYLMQTTNAWAKTLIKKYRAKLGPMRDNLGPRDLQSVPLKPGWREYSGLYVCIIVYDHFL
jgi:hypothetical protein